jgi:hypothetical protein
MATHYYAAIENAADNGRSRAGGFGQRDAAGVEGRIAVVVGEVETRHLHAVTSTWLAELFV